MIASEKVHPHKPQITNYDTNKPKKEIDDEKRELQRAVSEYQGLETKISKELHVIVRVFGPANHGVATEREKRQRQRHEIEASEGIKRRVLLKLEKLALERGKKVVEYSVSYQLTFRNSFSLTAELISWTLGACVSSTKFCSKRRSGSSKAESELGLLQRQECFGRGIPRS